MGTEFGIPHALPCVSVFVGARAFLKIDA